MAVPVAEAGITQTKQIWQVGFVPTLRYTFGQKGAALQACVGFWSFWQKDASDKKPTYQLQPELGLSYPLFSHIDLHASFRYQASTKTQWNTLSGQEQRVFYGIGLVWRR